MNHDYLCSMPKIELHCHLDGSLPLAALRGLARRAGVALPETDSALRHLVSVSEGCQSLTDYLSCFGLAKACMQTAENLYEAARAFLLDLAKEQVVYAEVRFAPLYSAHSGLSVEDVVGSVIQGLAAAHRESGVAYGVILCAMRDQPVEHNRRLLPVAARYHGQGVVALDLAGDEKRYPVGLHRAFFEEAARMGLPYVIHAGEADGADSVHNAVLLGARRIGHGIAMRDDPALMELCARKGIGVEVCPVSNTHTKAVRAMDDTPLKQFMRAGIPVTVNTDNRTVSGTCLRREFEALDKSVSLSGKEIATLYSNAVATSFAGDALKKSLQQRFDAFHAHCSAVENTAPC